MSRIPTGPARPPARWILGVGLVTSLVLGYVGLVPGASAGTITVTTFQDQYGGGAGSPCSLREAITAANDDAASNGCAAGSGADTIALQAGTYHLSLAPTGSIDSLDEGNGDLDVTSPITVVGVGSGATIIDGAWPAESQTDRIFHVFGSGELTLNGLAVRDGEPAFGLITPEAPFGARERAAMVERAEAIEEGFAASASPDCDGEPQSPEDGGGILVETDTSLAMNDVVVDHNATFEGSGGGLHIRCEATAVLTNVVFTRNFAATGGGILNAGTLTYSGGDIGAIVSYGDSWPDRNASVGPGGGLWNLGTAVLQGVDVFGNVTLIGSGGGIDNGGELSLERATISLNFAGSLFANFNIFSSSPDGGAISNADSEGPLSLTNVTISRNAAEGSGGGLMNAAADANLNNVTIALNRADDDNDGDGDGGGIAEAEEEADSINLRNTIVADNVDGSVGTDPVHPDCSGPVVSQGNNLVETTTGCTGLGATDRTGVDPLLLPLADNGGGTLTHALGAGSPAIDGGAGWAPVDQRGVPRPYGLAGDIGAYERFLCFDQAVNVVGTAASETIDAAGGPPTDVIIGLGGNDTIIAGPGADFICGGDGNDLIKAGSGRDKANGENGNDRLRGGGNPDLLLGGAGNDRFYGGGTLREKGDNCKGGPGKDKETGCEITKSV